MRGFLRDRLPYIACYAGFGLLALLVVQLDLSLSGHSLQVANLLYIGVLGLAGLLLFLAVAYLRQAEFLRRLQSISRTEPLDQLGLLPPARTHEQRLFAQAWAHLYGRLRAELTAEQERAQRNLLLVSQWAHHMKTPVAVIDLELQKAAHAQAQRSPDDEALLTSLAEENQRLSDSLQMLLNLVRLEDFAADFRVEPVDLTALVRTLINEHKRAFIVHRVYPRAQPTDASITVLSDAKWLRLVLEQIVSNAVKYASRSDQDGQVTFRCDRDGPATVLTVADNGIGIGPEDLGRVFTPFYTGANGRVDTRSTGMGLYLVREACRRLGHQVAIESRPGEGTKVSIRFTADELHGNVTASVR